jgi:hypothetical protein
VTRAADQPAVAWAARAGLVAKGVPYVVIAWLALEVAFGAGGKEADRTGALRTIASHPFGKVVLIALAAGFAGYAAWRFAQGVLDRDDDGWGKRAGAVAKGCLYVGFAYTTLKVVLGAQSSSNQKQQAKTAFDLPLGRELVFAAGLGFAGAAAYNVYRAVTRKFMRDLETNDAWVEWLGVAGHLARGAVWAIVGWFLVKAASEYDSRKAVGLDGALAKLAHRPYGAWLLGAVAAGLACYGLFCFVQARFRDI